MVDAFLSLTNVLFSHFFFYKQNEDIKFLVKYFCFIQTNLHIIEASKVPHYQFASHMIEVLAANLRSGSGNMIQDMEEMSALSHKLLSSDVSMTNLMSIHDIGTFSVAVTKTFYLDDANLPPEKVIQVLREVEMVLPDSHISVFRCKSQLLRYHLMLVRLGQILRGVNSGLRQGPQGFAYRSEEHTSELQSPYSRFHIDRPRHFRS